MRGGGIDPVGLGVGRQVNVWDNKKPDSADSAWQLGDKMTFAFHHYEDDGFNQGSPTKAIKDVNVWDNDKVSHVCTNTQANL